MNIKDIKALPAEPAKTKESKQVAMFLGVMLLFMAICQLINLSGFVGILYDFNLFPSYSDASAFAATLIFFEILAVPFLLRLKISPGLRGTSMIMGWLVILAWLTLSVWMLFAPVDTYESGLLGGAISILKGPWVLSFVGVLAVAMAWASWGLWPIKAPKKLKAIKKKLKINKNKTKKEIKKS